MSVLIGLAVFGLFMWAEATLEPRLDDDERRILYAVRGLSTAAAVATFGIFYVRREMVKATAADLRFKAVADSARDAIIEAAADGTILYANGAAVTMFGRADLAGSPLGSLVPDRFRAAHEAGLQRVAGGGEKKVIGQAVELAALRGDGTEVPVELSLSERHTPEGPRYIGILRDITERLAAASAAKERDEHALRLKHLEMADKLRNEFINNAAHELYTPLTPLRFQLRALKKKADAGMTEAIERLERSVDRLQSTIHQVLRVARLQGTAAPLPDAKLSLPDIVSQALDRVDALGDRQARAWTVELPDVEVRGVATQLVDAFYNLLENAFKFTEKGDAVSLTGKVEDGKVEVVIRDQGMGFDDDPESLFQSFVRGKAHRDDTEGGWGLGLHASRLVIDRHGGHVRIQSPGEGKGATVYVTLPIA